MGNVFRIITIIVKNLPLIKQLLELATEVVKKVRDELPKETEAQKQARLEAEKAARDKRDDFVSGG